MSCVNIPYKSVAWKNFEAKIGNRGKAIELYVMNDYNIPTEIAPPVVEDFRYKGLTIVKKQTLEFINERINALKASQKTATTADAIEMQKDINILEKQADKILLDIDELSNKEAKMQSLDNVSKYAEEDLEEISTLLTADTIDASSLEYIVKKLHIWQNAGNFDATHPFMTASELEEASQKDNPYSEIKDKFLQWKGRADSLASILNTKTKTLLEKKMRDELLFTGNIDLDTIPTVNALYANAIGISEMNSALIQSLQAWLTKADYEAKKESDVIFKQITGLMAKLDKTGSRARFTELIKQRTSDGKETGGIVQWKSTTFNDTSRNLRKDYERSLLEIEESNATNKAVLRNQAAKTYYANRKLIENGLDPHKLYSEDENVRSEYIDKLKSLVDPIIADILLAESDAKMEAYKKDKELFYTSISDKYVDDIDMLATEMSLWDALHSPYEVYNARFGKTMLIGSSYDYTRLSSAYIVSFPKTKVNINGVKQNTNFYDAKFLEIAKDKVYSEVYDYIYTTVRMLNSLAPKNELEFLDANSLPDIDKTILETMFEDGVGASMTAIYDKFIEATRTSNLRSTVEDVEIAQDGTIIKKLQTNFTGTNRKVIGDYIRLKTIQYNQKYGTNPDTALVDKWVIEIKDKLSKEKSWDLERVIKAFALSAISYKHKARVKDVMNVTSRQIQRSVTAEMKNNAGITMTNNGKIVTTKNLGNSLDIVTDYMDYFYGIRTKKEEGVLGKAFTIDEKSTKNEIEEAIQNNLDSYSEKLIALGEQLGNTKDPKSITELELAIEAFTASFTKNNDILHKQLAELGGFKVISRAADLLLKVNHLVRLAWNPLGAINNVTVGHLSLVIEASDGRRFNGEQLARAIGITASSVANATSFGLADNDNAKKVRALMLRYQVMQESQNEIYTFTHPTTKVGKAVGPMALTSRVEFLNQSNTLLPLLMNTKVTLLDGTVTNVFDASDIEGNLPEGALLSDNLGDLNEVALKLKIDDAIRSIHGNYDPNAKLMYKNSILGRAIGQFRTWAAMGFYDRFGSQKYNQFARMEKKGRYLSYGTLYDAQGFKALTTVSLAILKRLASAPIIGRVTGVKAERFEDIDGISEVDAANLRKNMAELAMLLIIAGSALLLQALLGDDDDEESALDRMLLFSLLNIVDRTATDLMFYSSPSAFQELNKSIIPVFGLLKDASKLGSHLGKVLTGGDDELETGNYAGWSGSFLYTTKLTPLGSQIPRIYNTVSRDISN